MADCPNTQTSRLKVFTWLPLLSMPTHIASFLHFTIPRKALAAWPWTCSKGSSVGLWGGRVDTVCTPSCCTPHSVRMSSAILSTGSEGAATLGYSDVKTALLKPFRAKHDRVDSASCDERAPLRYRLYRWSESVLPGSLDYFQAHLPGHSRVAF